MDMSDEPRKSIFRFRKKKDTQNLPKRGFWRGNLEAFTVAIVMALVIKTYAFEAFQVPTESMEPTIIGRTPGGDRIIVNKFKYQFSDPERYQVVVFRYPLARMVNYVKRLVGISGERLRIGHGDIYTTREEGDTFQIARKDRELCSTIFGENPVIPEKATEKISGAWVREWFHVPTSRVKISGKKGLVTMDAGNAELLLATKPGRLVPERRDRYADTRSSTGDRDVKEPLSDLRIDLTVTPSSGVKSVTLILQDGTQPNMPMRLDLAVSGGGGESTLTHGPQTISGGDAGGRLNDVTLKAGEEVDVRLENCDDRILVVVDGDEVLSYEYIQHWGDPPQGTDSQVKFGFVSGQGEISHIAIYRDIHYTVFEPTQKEAFDVPEGHYLFFGDNPENSLDARGWRVVGIRLREGGKILLGDMEAVSDSFEWPRRDNNPYFEIENGPQGNAISIINPSTHHFLDIFGNEWDLESGSYDILDLAAFGIDEGSAGILALHGTDLDDPTPEHLAMEGVTTAMLKARADPLHPNQRAFRAYSRLMHYVPRDNIMGQANMIFWPPSRWGVIR